MSSPLPLWGHRLPVIALALSARGLDKATEAFLDGVYGNWTLSLLALSSEDGVVSSGAH